MFNSMINWLTGFQMTSWMGIFLYWLPMSICVYGYTIRTWANYQKDIKKRDEAENSRAIYYSPTDTVGTLIGRAIVSILPIANLLAAIFDVAPRLLFSFYHWIEQVFDIPLVPQRKKE